MYCWDAPNSFATCSFNASAKRPAAIRIDYGWMEGGFSFGFGGDPEELMRSLREFAERQSEAVHESQRETFATLTLNTAVELAAAGLRPGRLGGSAGGSAPAVP